MADFSGPFSSGGGPKPDDDDDRTIHHEEQRAKPAPPRSPSPSRPSRDPAPRGSRHAVDDTLGPPPARSAPEPAPRRQDRSGERAPERTSHRERLSDSLRESSRSEASIDLGWRPELADTNNPLLDAARVTMVLVMRLRLAESAPPVEDLWEILNRHIVDFGRALNRARIPRDEIRTADYLLCTFVDEIIQSETVWGKKAGWEKRTLSSARHGNTIGGEEFFTFANAALNEPERSIDLLEFLYVCLCFGFRGVFRGDARDGERKIEDYRDRIYREVRSLRGEGDRDLSVRWRGVQEKRSLISYVPLWVIGSVCAAVLAATFLSLRLWLGAVAGPVKDALDDMGRGKLELATTAVAAPLSVPMSVRRLKIFLPGEIAEGLVTVDEFPDRSLVRLNSDGCFASGSATVQPACLATLGSVGAAVGQVAGPVEVVGHSDNQPIKSLRFDSNLELSLARAQSVVQALTHAGIPETRMRADGRGDAEPLPGADNASTAGRARNRRVEIVVYEGMSAPVATGFRAPAPISIVPR